MSTHLNFSDRVIPIDDDFRLMLSIKYNTTEDLYCVQFDDIPEDCIGERYENGIIMRNVDVHNITIFTSKMGGSFYDRYLLFNTIQFGKITKAKDFNHYTLNEKWNIKNAESYSDYEKFWKLRNH